MKAKRKQYKVMQVRFNEVTDKEGKLTITDEPRLIANSENLFYDLLFRLQSRKYDIDSKRWTK